MKTRLILICFAFQFAIALCIRTNGQTGSQQFANAATNAFSLDQNDIRDDRDGNGHLYYVDCLIHHEVMPETLPVDQDTNDLWGPPTNGMQLSIRLHNKEYSIGNVIAATTILRNLEPSSRTLLLTNCANFYMTLLVHNGTNGFLSERKFEEYRSEDNSSMPSPPRGYMAWGWGARSEKEIVSDLDYYFNMAQPGDYSVRAVCRVYSPTNKVPLYEISSGTATFRLLPKPAPNPQK